MNYVGVDLNTASPALLRYVSGLNQLTARRVYDHRTQHGPFRTREQLKEVAGFGEAAFVQAAGFLKISGDNPLDATWIHPESYELAGRVLETVGGTVHDLADKEAAGRVSQKTAELDLEALGTQWGAGTLLLQDILAQLARPGRDPREDLPPPIFKKGVLKLDDLTQGMELAGTVLNVVDFGAFVDIGLHDTGLVHISQLANKYVRDPHDVVSVGDIVKVWVHEIDKTRRRVSLTMIPPGSQRSNSQRGVSQRSGSPRSGSQGPSQQGAAATTSETAVVGEGDAALTTEATADGGATSRPARHDRPAAQQGRGQQGGSGRGRGGQDREGQGHAGSGNAGSQSRPGKPKYQTHAAAAKPPRPAKPLKPLTSGMKEGKEPLRTFGDLKQFFELKKEPDEGAAETS